MEQPILDHLLRSLDGRTCSLRELSGASGVPYDTLCKIAQRKQVPRLDTAERLLRVFPLPIAATSQAPGEIPITEPPPVAEAARQEAA